MVSGKIVAPTLGALLIALPLSPLAAQPAMAAPAAWPAVGITASTDDGNPPTNTVDADLTTRWAAQSANAETAQWIEFDFGQIVRVGYGGAAWHQGDRRSYSYELQSSTDCQNWTPVGSGTSSGSTLQMEPLPLLVDPGSGVEARCMRYLGYGSDKSLWNSVTELRFYPPADSMIVDEFNTTPPTPEPEQVSHTAPGLTDPAGDPITVEEPANWNGRIINVVDHGADPAPGSADDAAAIRAAIAEAKTGDSVWLPAGSYELNSVAPNDQSANLRLAGGIRFFGDGPDKTRLISNLTAETRAGKVLRASGLTDLMIAELTISSTWDGAFSTDPTDNAAGGGPEYGIYISQSGTRPSQRVLVSNVHVERFAKMGIRIEKSRQVTVRGCHFADATGVGGGGKGYGIAIQGTAGVDRTGFPDDSLHNVIAGNTFDGTHLRHAILLQYHTHNNLITGNTITGGVLDAIDLHGEGEYLNEISHNVVTGNARAAIGVGNTGGSASLHGASGPGNWIHHNRFTDNQDGVVVMLGSQGTVIEHNTIDSSRVPAARSGITVLNGPGTVIRANIIKANRVAGFWGIVLEADPGQQGGQGGGVPTDVRIEKNRITANHGGLRIEAGQRIGLTCNRITRNQTDLLIAPGADVTVG